MVFSSAIFLFAFLPVILALHSLLPSQRARNAAVVAGSLVFYAFGCLSDVPVLLASVCVQYAAGRLLMRPGKGRRPVLIAAVILDLGLLFAAKYLGQLAGALGVPDPGLRLPLGVSFFTFQGLSYTLDAYRDPAKGSRNFWRVLEFMAFFPVLLSGPLMRFDDLSRQFERRGITPEKTAAGIRRFVPGLAKKLLLAGGAGAAADAVFALAPGQLDLRTAWLGAVAYTLELYFDFSGYSDMAVGLGEMMGFAIPENFREPFGAASVGEFWRRWHITLSAWFRDYVYIPLGGNRKGKARTALNKLLVFFLTGLWHGAAGPFLLWGLWHGALVSLEGLKPVKNLKNHWYGHLFAMLAVVLGFAMFRSQSAAQGFALIGRMFAGFSRTAESTLLLAHLSRRNVFLLLLGALLALPPVSRLPGRLPRTRFWAAASAAGTLALLAVCIACLASGSFQPFIYFRF
jgi:alginate O-acetyltransferase complex protein AlgI